MAWCSTDESSNITEGPSCLSSPFCHPRPVPVSGVVGRQPDIQQERQGSCSHISVSNSNFSWEPLSFSLAEIVSHALI